MEQGSADHLAEYGFQELPTVVEGHRTFILIDLLDRYANREGKYVIILHKAKVEHYIMGVYEDLREALQTRYVSNLLLHGGHKFDGMHFVQVHDINGPVVDDMIYDAKHNVVKRLEVQADDSDNDGTQQAVES